MDKSHDMDDITLLASRFHALVDKVQGLIDELHESPPPGIGGGVAVKDRPGSGRKAYTIHTSHAHDKNRQKALIKVIDDALKQIDNAVSPDAEKEPNPGSSRRVFFQYEKKLFSIEELRFLENTFRAFHSATAQEVHSDS